MAFCSAIASSRVAARHDAEHRAEVLGQVELAARGARPARTPGDQRRPLSSSWRGSTSHDSPAPSVVSARASLPEAGSMIGPIWVVGLGRVADAHGRGRVDELATEPLGACRQSRRGSRGSRPSTSGPAWPKARLDHVGGREVEVGARRDDDGVLAARLGEQRQVGAASERNSCGRLEGAGEDDAVDRGVRDEVPAEVALVDVDERSTSRGTPASHSASTMTAPQRFAWRGRLDDDAAARGERGERRAGGDRDREVPRRGDERQALAARSRRRRRRRAPRRASA